MNESFDPAAKAYDETFTNSTVGRLQRQQVYLHLQKQLDELKPSTVLEINCGTGADALWLAEKGLQVLATDISPEMIAVASQKGKGSNPEFRVLDLRQLQSSFKDRSFDLVFSDFGGLNCLSPEELQDFFTQTAAVLEPEGEMALVIMPRNTRWEKFYFTLKGRFSQASRRNKVYAMAHVDGVYVKTWYYNPEEVKRAASPYFSCQGVHPIGYWVPPSYMETFFRKHPNWLNKLAKWDLRATHKPGLAHLADHFYIRLRRL